MLPEVSRILNFEDLEFSVLLKRKQVDFLGVN